jgi:hypothetical protein
MFASSEILGTETSSYEDLDLNSDGLELLPNELKFEFNYFVFNNRLPMNECFSEMSY